MDGDIVKGKILTYRKIYAHRRISVKMKGHVGLMDSKGMPKIIKKPPKTGEEIQAAFITVKNTW